TYAIEAHISGGTATAATHKVVHAGVTDSVVIDQSTADGFVPLGEFALAADGTEYVQLGDNTGSEDQHLVVDAPRVTATDDGGDGGGGIFGGCASGGGGSLLGTLLALFTMRLRRRHTPAR